MAVADHNIAVADCTSADIAVAVGDSNVAVADGGKLASVLKTKQARQRRQFDLVNVNSTTSNIPWPAALPGKGSAVDEQRLLVGNVINDTRPPLFAASVANCLLRLLSAISPQHCTRNGSLSVLRQPLPST